VDEAFKAGEWVGEATVLPGGRHGYTGSS
jgi:hypothetical protein